MSSRSQSHMITFFFCSQVANSLCDQECQELCRGRVIDMFNKFQQFPRVQAFCPLLFKHQPLVHRVAFEWSCVVLCIAVGVGGARQCSLTHFIALEECEEPYCIEVWYGVLFLLVVPCGYISMKIRTVLTQ